MKFLNILVILCVFIAIAIFIFTLNKKINTFEDEIIPYKLFENDFHENQKMSLEMAIKLINKYNSGKKQIIDGKNYKYNRFTINKTLRKEIHTLLSPIICKIDGFLQTKYKIVELESVEKIISKDNKEILYKVEFFIVELNETRSNKLYAEIHYNINNKRIHINNVEINNCNLINKNCLS